MTMTMNYEEIYGQTNSIHCKRILRELVRGCNGRRGRMELYAQRGFNQLPVYSSYGRTLGGPREKVGCQHAKLMYVHPFLLIGSTNWSVSSETNREHSCLIWIGESSGHMMDSLFERLERNAKVVQERDLFESSNQCRRRG